MLSKAIVSMAFGKDWWRLAATSFPTFEAYADSIGADFLVLSSRRYNDRHVHWEKLRLFEILIRYERVMWVDADAVIRPDAPSVFEIVPEDAFGAFDESKICSGRDAELASCFSFYGKRMKVDNAGRYFNAGVMILSRRHATAFMMPNQLFTASGMPEQTYLNMEVAHRGYEFFDLGSSWNAFHSAHSPEDRLKANIIHYAGRPKEGLWVDAMSSDMNSDLNAWVACEQES